MQSMSPARTQRTALDYMTRLLSFPWTQDTGKRVVTVRSLFFAFYLELVTTVHPGYRRPSG